jgi:hypothetical protein
VPRFQRTFRGMVASCRSGVTAALSKEEDLAIDVGYLPDMPAGRGPGSVWHIGGIGVVGRVGERSAWLRGWSAKVGLYSLGMRTRLGVWSVTVMF